MTDIVNDIFNKLPVDYNLVPWVTKKMEVGAHVGSYVCSGGRVHAEGCFFIS